MTKLEPMNSPEPTASAIPTLSYHPWGSICGDGLGDDELTGDTGSADSCQRECGSTFQPVEDVAGRGASQGDGE
jgi:hypothetical protein